MNRVSLNLLLSCVAWLTVAFSGRCAEQSGTLEYNRDIRPILSENCFTCHGSDSGSRKAKLRLDIFEDAIAQRDKSVPAIVPGHPEQSEIIRRVFDDGDDIMPPEKAHRTLTTKQKETLKKWVAEGAHYQPHWAFIPIRAVKPPIKPGTHWGNNEVDAFILGTLEEQKLKPSPVAAPEILIRRLALNLTGLPPALKDVDAFVLHHTKEDYKRLVEKYLASPGYGERMALDWLDLARYADTYGYQTDMERDMSAYRDWVIHAFNHNLRYDDFLRRQIAGDLLPDATDDDRVATAFNRLHRQTNEGGSIDEEYRDEYGCDRVNTMGTAMLGLTVGCARCHDHKYDPISQKDYYSLFAYFNNIDESGVYSHFTRATPSPAMLLWDEAKKKRHLQLSQQIKDAEVELANHASSNAASFTVWNQNPQIEIPVPIHRFTFDTVVSNTTVDAVSTNRAKFDEDVRVVDGHAGKALKFTGDDQLTCKGVGEFHRSDSFSISLWIKPEQMQDRAVILHHSRAWTDSGSRGYELVLDHGKPFFGISHFWPGNAMAIECHNALPTNEWSNLILTYDGSSRAEGMKLYLNGKVAGVEVVRDHLYKDIVHRKEWGDMEAGNIPFTLAGRFRDSGFKNGAIDDLQIFDRALGGLEARVLCQGDSKRLGGDDESAMLKEYFLQRCDDGCKALTAKLAKLRSEDFRLVDGVPEIMVMQEMPGHRVTHILKRGAYDAPGDEVQPGVPERVFAISKDAPQNRLGLAHWLVDRANPLVSRVAVNRIWKMHFGRGIVATPEDFGSQGRLPSHPELLDFLATWFMDHDWDVKALHRLIVNSDAFQQSSVASRELMELDPDNQFVARGPKMRMIAEQIRDCALAESGLLNAEIGGTSVFPYQPAGLWEQSGTGKTYTQDHGEKLYRRSLYTFWRRTSPPPSMLTFDSVSREVCTAKRENTATPLQSLVLLNDTQFIEAARVLGEKLLRQHSANTTALIAGAFRTLAGRTPDDKEMSILSSLLTEQRGIYASSPEDAARLVSVGEHKRDETLSTVELAATTMLVSAIMNHDEFVVER